MKKITILILVALGVLASCAPESSLEAYFSQGVSLSLAEHRKAGISNLEYNLFFSLPLEIEKVVDGTVSISFDYKHTPNTETLPLLLDFKARNPVLANLKVNGKDCAIDYRDEHIRIPDSLLVDVGNVLSLEFEAPNQSLNRRRDFMYTLLVPDRARTLFPCFDQPDLKARFSLCLEMPQNWVGVSNAGISKETEAEEGFKQIVFGKSGLISTYLFSFVAGEFESFSLSRPYKDGQRSVSLYHRETDAGKRSQCEEILNEVMDCLEWMEEWTEVDYPFEKYDLIVLPGFQYGGMEHMGATLYNDTRIFLPPQAGESDSRNRFSLIAHETAHMWFGDFVTMSWFDDVWTKEVFANYFAAVLSSIKFPQKDSSMEFVSYQRSAYAEDRSRGAMPVKQPLENLKDAGLIYSNVVYNKTPILMNMLSTMMGQDAFQQGIRAYLKKFAYSNASWDDLIAVLDPYSPLDLTSWSRAWVYTAGMPEVKAVLREGKCYLYQSDEQRVQTLQLSFVLPNERKTSLVTLHSSDTVFTAPEGALCVLPNLDAKAYGYFPIEAVALDYLLDNICFMTELESASALVLLYENLLQGRIDPLKYRDSLIDYLQKENGNLLFSMAASDLQKASFLFDYSFEPHCWENLARNHPSASNRREAFLAWVKTCNSPEDIQYLKSVLLSPQTWTAFKLSETDRCLLSYELAVRLPSEAEMLLDAERSRLQNPDRIARFDFVRPALSPDSLVRDNFFESLLEPENREVEPWVVTALNYLHHPLRCAQSLKYIEPSLEEMEEIQQTGDIFFPRNWASSTLSKHKGVESEEIVEAFLNSRPDYPVLLKSKILQQLPPIASAHSCEK